MAHHVEQQQSYKNCRSLLKELERVVGEELQLRKKLLDTGVRDVSDEIELPKNGLEQLDEDSAEYDDKRLCHACKHVCFFSAVACVCSQSNVSCLRHSHYMCRCPVERRYLMIWSPEEELNSTVRRVHEHCESLKPKGQVDADEVVSAALDTLPPVAVGAERDLEEHKEDPISIEPYEGKDETWHPIKEDPVKVKYEAKVEPTSTRLPEVTTDEDRGEEIVIDDSDDDIEIVAVRDSSTNSY
jgi:hypothetical protein